MSINTPHTPLDWEFKRALVPDNTGAYDYSITQEGDTKIIAEVFEHVGYADDTRKTFEKFPAAYNAQLICRAVNYHNKLFNALVAIGEASPGTEVWAEAMMGADALIEEIEAL